MDVPAYVLTLMHRLEQAGFAAYAVGGCVRDSLLGLTPHDYDLCTAAPPEKIREIFQDYPMFLSGIRHGTVSIICPEQVVEITTFRTESGYSDHRHPDQVAFVPQVEADLARRDFTINALAWSPSRGLCDPFGGRADLENRVLRAVGEPSARFREDPLRILRGLRFSARFRLTPEERTLAAMLDLAPLMDSLARERVFSELCGLLPWVTAADLALFAPILAQVIPELAPCVGLDQRSPHHAYDLFTHIAHVVEAVPAELPLRWAALLHDVGKPRCFTTDATGRGHFYGHAQVGADMAGEILLRLKAPTALTEAVVWLISKHMTPLEPDRKLLRRRLSQYGPQRTRQLLALQKADFCSKGVADAEDAAALEETGRLLEALLQEELCLSVSDLAVNGEDLISLGFQPGPQLGRCLQALLEQVVSEKLPNTRPALLARAEAILRGKETL